MYVCTSRIKTYLWKGEVLKFDDFVHSKYSVCIDDDDDDDDDVDLGRFKKGSPMKKEIIYCVSAEW